MLQLAQRTSAPSSASVSISTAVCTVMCSEPEMRAPLSGLLAAYSSRNAISPGISCSASVISLRPKSASVMSAILKSAFVSVRGRLRVLVIVQSLAILRHALELFVEIWAEDFLKPLLLHGAVLGGF